MALSIQTQTGPAKDGPSTTGLLVRAMFWVALAVVAHVSLIPELPRDIIGYAYWAPHAFAALGILNIARAVRGLLNDTRIRRKPPQIQRNVASRRAPMSAKPASSGGLRASRIPTVQRRH